MENDRYLLIWEENPEEIKYYSLPVWEVESERQTLEGAHGKMVNASEDQEAALKVCGFVQKGWEDERFSEVHPEGKWCKYQLDISELPTHQFLGVFKSGFVL